jgi:triosephosphate isomerase
MKYIVGNWKMNGLAEAGLELAEAVARHKRPEGAEVVICPPFTLLAQAAWKIRGQGTKLGGQDCHTGEFGAFTGDISAVMLKDAGCTYVILGHSERRQFHAESNALVRQKAQSALKAGLVPIICVGESPEERDAGKHLEVLERQVAESVPQLPASSFQLSGKEADSRKLTAESYLIAYEPVWAIGSGRTPSLEQIAQAHKHIAKSAGGAITPPILYGGSVKPGNARDILHTQGVDGVLVGGASLKAVEFCAIIDGVASFELPVASKN